MSYQLREVRSREDWTALHHIRRTVLFAPGRRSREYDENHPDDRSPTNRPFLLMSKDEAVGVVRLDQRGTTGVVRMVAIISPMQRSGLGRILGELLDAEARRLGMVRLRVSANADAVAFYEKTGWHRAAADQTSAAADSVKMEKVL